VPPRQSVHHLPPPTHHLPLARVSEPSSVVLF
jgi:hypothetical protein